MKATKAMNLSIREIVIAHAERIANAYSAVHERLMNFDSTRKVPDYIGFLNQLNQDKAIRIDINGDAYDKSNIEQLASYIAERILEAEDTYNGCLQGNNYVNNPWVLYTAWKLEISERGESDKVTIGASPLTMRMLALIQYERERLDIVFDDPSLVPGDSWCNGLKDIKPNEVSAMAQEYLDTFMLIDSGDDDLLQIEDLRIDIESENVKTGHLKSVTVELCPGEITFSGTLKIRDEGEISDNIYLDGASILLPDVIPEAIAATLHGKNIEEVIDHELFRGLEITISEVTKDKDGTRLTIMQPKNQPLIITDPPKAWAD